MTKINVLSARLNRLRKNWRMHAARRMRATTVDACSTVDGCGTVDARSTVNACSTRAAKAVPNQSRLLAAVATICRAGALFRSLRKAIPNSSRKNPVNFWLVFCV